MKLTQKFNKNDYIVFMLLFYFAGIIAALPPIILSSYIHEYGHIIFAGGGKIVSRKQSLIFHRTIMGYMGGYILTFAVLTIGAILSFRYKRLLIGAFISGMMIPGLYWFIGSDDLRSASQLLQDPSKTRTLILVMFIYQGTMVIATWITALIAFQRVVKRNRQKKVFCN